MPPKELTPKEKDEKELDEKKKHTIFPLGFSSVDIQSYSLFPLLRFFYFFNVSRTLIIGVWFDI